MATYSYALHANRVSRIEDDCARMLRDRISCLCIAANETPIGKGITVTAQAW